MKHKPDNVKPIRSVLMGMGIPFQPKNKNSSSTHTQSIHSTLLRQILHCFSRHAPFARLFCAHLVPPPLHHPTVHCWLLLLFCTIGGPFVSRAQTELHSSSLPIDAAFPISINQRQDTPSQRHTQHEMVSREGKTWECYQSTDALLLHAIAISPFAFCFSSCWVIALFIKHELVDREHFSSVRDNGHTARLHAARDQRELTCYAGLCCGMLHRFLSLRQILTAERSHRKHSG